jgi:HpcH/HpaI aldolase/citrate lyase family
MKSMKTRVLGAAIAAAAMAASPSVLGHDDVWRANTAKRNIISGAPLVAKRVASADPAQYCAAASTPHTHFTWVETVSSELDYTHAWAIWAADCPTAVATMRGAEVTYAERVEPASGAIPTQAKKRQLADLQIQKATDGGAVVLLVPVDTAAEAAQAVRRAYYPPMGTRSFGPGQFDAVYAGVTSNYRRTYNDNVVLIAIVSTVEGAYNADDIAGVRGIHAIFLDAMNLESSSGYLQATKEYKMLASAITDAAQKERLHLCTADRSTTPHTLTCTRKQGNKGHDDDDDDDD